MPLITVEATCAICGKDTRKPYDNGLLTELVFCDECRKRLRALLYNEQEVATNSTT